MYAQIDKTKENKSQVIAITVTQKNSSKKQGYGFVDNRSETTAQRKDVTQLVQVGKAKVKDADALAQILSKTPEEIVKKLSDILENDLKSIDKDELSEFLNATPKRVRHYSTSQYDEFIGQLAKMFERYYTGTKLKSFKDSVTGIANEGRYTSLMNPQQYNYNGNAGGDDGQSVTNDWNSNLACSLYALLIVKPGFLGAHSPKELHKIFRLNKETEKYDENKVVAKIRMAAGLNYSITYQGKSITEMVNSFKRGDFGRKIIVDPLGEAHTFALKFDNGWKKYDNATPNGTSHLGADQVGFTWEV